ncbi:hypothetical protein SDJN02_14835, partial [Cucurbita argyrosperma subsp. argyrosperma]
HFYKGVETSPSCYIIYNPWSCIHVRLLVYIIHSVCARTCHPQLAGFRFFHEYLAVLSYTVCNARSNDLI